MKLKRRFSLGKAQVDLIPMIDVVFQLILFFLVSTTFVLLPGIKLNLPESTTAESVETTGLTITANADGTLWLNDTPITYGQLSSELAEYPLDNDKRAEFPISLEADAEVQNGTIVKILDILRQTGFSAVNLRTTEGT